MSLRESLIAQGVDLIAECKHPLAERAGGTALGPLKRGADERASMAALVNDVLFRRWERGDDNCSTRAIALRCKVNQSTIHEYRHGEKMVPWALAKVLSIEVVEEINETLIASRAGGRTWRWALALTRRGLDWIEERGIRTEDRYEAKSALYDAQDRITRALRRLDEEGGSR